MTEFTSPRRLNHVAYVTWDTEATIRFYTEILGMRLVGHAEADNVGSTREQTRLFHVFFAMRDGSCIAFFDIEGLPPDDRPSVVPSWARHLALSVDGMEELESARASLIAKGVDVLGPVDHEGIWKSIYFFDPNGIRLELTYQNRELTDADAEAAQQATRQWVNAHA